MGALRSITLIACFLGIAISMFDIVTPSEKLKKQIRFIFSLVFIIAIITPILNGNVNFEIPTVEKIENSEEYIAVTKAYNESLANIFKTNIEKNLKEKLSVNNINAKNVSLIVNIDEKDSISISEADVVLAVSQMDLEDKAISVVQNEIGNTKVKVSYSEVKDEQKN